MTPVQIFVQETLIVQLICTRYPTKKIILFSSDFESMYKKIANREGKTHVIIFSYCPFPLLNVLNNEN